MTTEMVERTLSGMKSHEAIMQARSRAKFARRLTDAQVQAIVAAVREGKSYNAAGALVGVSHATAAYWFKRSGSKRRKAQEEK